ncbi:hypothetical protein CAP48_00355 [Advenella sp. S44]|uniref:hypothetical protein n=1 Tax=Advenella sp. S44 TaxID=1982755 RepID=UPI000C2AA7C2|nr:hypothetical protein [Advenella sp. S44]PJX27686.1 hypothetical protein CAP48_00355 [Advenella sp. S44]
MYDIDDPRATLPTATEASSVSNQNEGPWGLFSCIHFKQSEPFESDELSKRWYARGNNFVLCYAEMEQGAIFQRDMHPDEYVVIAVDRDAGFCIDCSSGCEDVPGFSIAFVPRGDSTMTATGTGRFIFLFTSASIDLASKAINSETYKTPNSRVAPFKPWPQPHSPAKLHWYNMDVADEPGRFGRIWRCSSFMVNLIVESGPRNIEKVSPHHHDDFEQASLLLEGTMTHHMRWPWTSNMRHWLPDQHLDCESPSLNVIPPPAIHTSNATSSNGTLLFDIFCPPRVDFSLKPGWVLNANDYPMPQKTEKADI